MFANLIEQLVAEDAGHVYVGNRQFSDKDHATKYAESIDGVVTPSQNPQHKGFLTSHQSETIARLRAKGHTYHANAIHQSWKAGKQYHDEPAESGFKGITVPKQFKKAVDTGNEHVD